MKKCIILMISLFMIISFTNSFSNYSKSPNKMIETTFTEKTVKITCTEMSCKACKQSITKAISKLEGIISLDISLENKIISVVIDESKTDEQSVLNAIIGAGYDAELIK